MQLKLFEALTQIPLFSQISEPALQELATHAVTKAFPKHAVIVSEGDETGSFYFLLSGRVRIYLSNEEGKEVTMSSLRPGEYFGEYALLDDAPRSASVMASEKTICGVISKPAFKIWVSEHPDVAMGIIQALVKKIRCLSDDVKALALLDVYGRLARKLTELSVERDGKQVISPKPTQQDLANMIGSSREMVAKINKELELGGYMSVSGKELFINRKLPSAW